MLAAKPLQLYATLYRHASDFAASLLVRTGGEADTNGVVRPEASSVLVISPPRCRRIRG